MSTLNQLNRSFVRIAPKKTFWELIQPRSNDVEFFQFHEPTLYLIDEEFWDESAFLEDNSLKIAQFEFEQHVSLEDVAEYLPHNTASFLALFEVEFGSTVVDLISKPGLSYL
jgi:hypothetical protein